MLSGTVDAALAKIGLDVWADLSAERFDAVRTRLEQALAADLTPKRLKEIMDGVQKAHGTGRVIDAWETTVREEGEQLPAASVLLRMAKSKTRFRLLLVFNPNASIRGFWFKPI